MTEILDLTLGIIKNVLQNETDEQKPFEQAVHEDESVEMFAIRIKTGFEANYTQYNEIRFINIQKLKPSKLGEICLRVLSWKPFTYKTGYEHCFGTTIFIFPENVKGVFKPRILKDPVLGKVAIIVIDPRVSKDKQKASYFAYLTSYFAQRAENLLSKLINKKPFKVGVWYRVRAVFAGKLDSLSSSLTRLYYYIHNRVESFRANNNASSELLKTLTVLNELFYKFAKAFDRFAKDIYLRALAQKAHNTLKKLVPSHMINKVLKILLSEGRAC